MSSDVLQEIPDKDQHDYSDSWNYLTNEANLHILYVWKTVQDLFMVNW